MSTYIIAQILIHDREVYKVYEQGFMERFSDPSYGLEVVGFDENPEILEGEYPYSRTVILRFPDEDAALRWYRSDAYQEIVKHRHSASTGRVIMVRGVPGSS